MNRTVAATAIVCSVAGALAGHLATRWWMYEPSREDAEQVVERIAPTRKFAQGIQVPVIDFDGASLMEVVDYLRSISRTGIAIQGEPAPYRLNFVVDDPDRIARPVVLRMKDVRLDQLCERVAQMAGIGVSFEDDAIVFAAHTKPNKTQQ